MFRVLGPAPRSARRPRNRSTAPGLSLAEGPGGDALQYGPPGGGASRPGAWAKPLGVPCTPRSRSRGLRSGPGGGRRGGRPPRPDPARRRVPGPPSIWKPRRPCRCRVGRGDAVPRRPCTGRTTWTTSTRRASPPGVPLGTRRPRWSTWRTVQTFRRVAMIGPRGSIKDGTIGGSFSVALLVAPDSFLDRPPLSMVVPCKVVDPGGVGPS